MSIRRHDAKRDANEPMIVAAFEALYCQVYRLDAPCDLLVQHPYESFATTVQALVEQGKTLEQVQAANARNQEPEWLTADRISVLTPQEASQYVDQYGARLTPRQSYLILQRFGGSLSGAQRSQLRLNQ